MPRQCFAAECKSAIRSTRLNRRALADIKRRCGIPNAAILHRGRQLGVFTDEQYRSGTIDLNRRGEARRGVEDEHMVVEAPNLIADS